MIEKIVHKKKTFALVFRKGIEVQSTKFLTPDESPLQVGYVVRKKGYVEPPHIHKRVRRVIEDVQQMLHIQRGIVVIDFFGDEGDLIESVELKEGDAILLMEGAHSIRVIKDLKCLSVKQGPFLGHEEDKIEVGRKK